MCVVKCAGVFMFVHICVCACLCDTVFACVYMYVYVWICVGVCVRVCMTANKIEMLVHYHFLVADGIPISVYMHMYL